MSIYVEIGLSKAILYGLLVYIGSILSQWLAGVPMTPRTVAAAVLATTFVICGVTGIEHGVARRKAQRADDGINELVRRRSRLVAMPSGTVQRVNRLEDPTS